jgi:hypothetical protein
MTRPDQTTARPDAAARLKPVPAAGLPEYPIPRSERLPELSFIKWQSSRWLASRGSTSCTYEVQGVARALFDLALAQSPIGTLPDNDEDLSALLRLPQPQWQALRGLGDRGPLRNWHPCISDGEVRLMHRVVTQELEDVLHRREARELSKEAAAEAKRMKRLAEGMVRAGMAPSAAEDMILMDRINAWLGANWSANRSAVAYARAYDHAVRQGWL